MEIEIFDEFDQLLIDECYEVALKISNDALEIIEAVDIKDKQFTFKSCQTDLVTQTDKRVEEFIFGSIKLKYPLHKLIGEESDENPNYLTDEFTWIIDPIDGTTNFIHGFPFFAISIGILVIGIVLNGFTKDLYQARIGTGSFKNGKKIQVSKIEKKNEAILMTEWGVFHNKELTKQKLDTMMSIFSENGSVHGIRSLGCASLNLCMIAEGKGDIYFEWGLHCWDIAAGVLIVKEAGGFIFSCNDKEFNLMKRNILAVSTNNLKNDIIKHIPNFNY